MENPEFLLKKNWAISCLEWKLKFIDMELSTKYSRTITQKVESRIKSVESIVRKLQKKGCEATFENALAKCNDIVGIRVVCLYSDDVYKIADLLKQQDDIELIKEKDYIKNPKKSGYQSLHLIVEVPFTYKKAMEKQRVEIQIRTVAMDFWAGVDNQICYKKTEEEVRRAEGELKQYSDVIAQMDKQMLGLRKKVEKIRGF